ncbi:MAG TPA: M20/M25/M40 family metallo-hydrolase [Chitinophagaceae bacterium]|nr:M20/M25/M40 family metallo-hydrolase [Chitinophagaceae bacterium]
MRKSLPIIIIMLLVQHIVFSQAKETMKIREWRQKNENRLLKDYMNFLAVPNIAADTVSLLKNADIIMDMLRTSGVQNVQLLNPITKGAAPAVFGEVKTPGAKQTIIFYAHYDGQPVNPANWYKGLDPFRPVLTNGPLGDQFQVLPLPDLQTPIDPEWRIFGRGASDDKAGVMAIINAYQALVSTGQKPTVNIKFFFEGEEEAGSAHLGEILETYKLLLGSDLWIMCDGPVHQSGRKSISFGVRGDANMELIIYGPNKPLHSGHYGNWVRNPAWQLVQLLATMKNEKGEVTIKGYYDDVMPLSDLEKKALSEIPAVDEQMKKELGILATESEGRALYESYNLPSLNINGIRSADVGAMAANVIPVKASVALDLRQVAGTDWQKQQEKVIEHIRSKGYFVTEKEPTAEERSKYADIIQVLRKSGYNAQKTRMDLPVAEKLYNAVQSTTADKVVRVPTMGGSLPLFIFEKTLGATVITVPIANHDNNQHAENENIRIRNLWNGIETMAAIMMMK